MSSQQHTDDKLQIVAFSTNATTQTPIDIINMFLLQQNHTIIKQSRHAIAFSTNLKNSKKMTTIMVRSILNLSREYTGINDVNCYLLFFDLENKESMEKLDLIINYASEYCELMKKIYVLGMISGKDGDKQIYSKTDIINKLNQAKINYEYKEINLSKSKEIAGIILEILDYCSKNEINGDLLIDSDLGQAKSCSIF